jgi:hypothetical protein
MRGQKKWTFRSKSSDLPMQILWAFRYNPSRPTGFSQRQLWNQAAKLPMAISRIRVYGVC